MSTSVQGDHGSAAGGAVQDDHRALELIARFSSDVLVQIGRDGRIAYISESIAKYGYAPAELVGTDGRQLFHPDEQARSSANIAAQLAGRPAPDTNRRYRVRGGDGRWFWVEANPQVVLDADGRPTGLINVFRDVDEQERMIGVARERGELFEAVFNHSASAKVVLSLDGEILRANVALLKLLGYRAEEVIGRRDNDFAHPDEIGRFDAQYRALLAGELQSYTVERRYRRSDGVYIWCALVVSVAAGADGAPKFILCELQDQTQSRAAEVELRRRGWALAAYARSTAALLHAESLDQLTSSVCEAVVGRETYLLATVHLADPPPSKVIRIAAHAGRASGYIDGLSLSWDDGERDGNGPAGRSIRSRTIQVTADCETDPHFAAWRDAAGRFGIRSSVAVPFFDGDRVLGVLSVYAARPNAFDAFALDLFRKLADEMAFTIVLETKRAEQEQARQARLAAELAEAAALRAKSEQERIYRLVVENIGDVIFKTDRNLVFDYVSPSVKSVSGWDEQVWLGKSALTPIHSEHSLDILDHLRRGAALPSGRDNEFRFERPDGSKGWAQANPTFIRDENGEFAGLLVAVRDITDRREVEDRLEDLNSQLAHLGRLAALNEMGAALAHELNQPLAAAGNLIHGCIRILAQEPVDVALVSRSLQLASDQMVRAAETIRNVRAFSAKRESVQMPEPLAPLVEEAGTLAMVGPHGRGLRPAYAFDADVGEVCVDRVQIQQVILNLMRNAAEAMAESPRRELTVRAKGVDGGMVEISVADTGPGLAPEVAGKLFQPFVTTKAEGMGVGLSISRAIVEAHGGRLWWEPNPEGGAIFRFTVRRTT